MKKALLIMVVALFAMATMNAQKGDFTLSTKITGFDLAFGEDDQMKFNLAVAGSHFLTDKVAVEAILGFAYEDNGYDDASAITFGFGAKYYFWETLFGGLAYQGTKYSEIDLVSHLHLSVGYDIFISEKVFVTPGLYYAIGVSDTAANVFGLSLSFGMKF